MKTIIKLIQGSSILALLFFTGACGKSPFCWGDDKNKGIIEQSISVPCYISMGGEIIIDSDSVYSSVVDSSAGCVRTNIDFTKHTLLGLTASGGCTMKLKRVVTKNDANKEYVYKVIARDCGMCRKQVFDNNWVLVPKLPEGWAVRFELEEK